MEDDDLIYAVDPRGVYPLSDPDTALLWVELRGLRRTPLHGSITVRGAEATWPGPGPLQLREATGTGNTRRYNGTVSHWVQGRCLALPAASAGAAVIDFAFDALKTSVPVRRVLENGITAETFENGISVSVSRVTKQPDIPAPIGQKSVTFVARVRPETPTAVLHLRAVTRSGRTYRGRPLLVSTTRSGEKTALPVFSDTQRKPVVVKVDPWRVPDIAYEISPTYGAILHTPAGRPFWGNMGAYVDTSTGRGGGEGGNDSLPYFIERGTYPEKATRTAPSLVEEDGTPCLKFDGIGNFVALPAEVIPRRGSYTLSFEIKPLSTEPQVLFIHHGYYIGSVVVSLVDGKLAVSRTNERMHQARAQSELEVPAGKWSQVEVVFDLAAIRLRVNGKKCPPIPSAGPGLYIVPSAFGGWGSADTGEFIGRTGWFEGYLRSLRIRHTVGEG